MQNAAYAPQIVKAHQKISKVVDGDGLYVVDMFGKSEIEIRFLGIDSPEIHRSKKLMQDERETHLPGELLIQLGLQSKQFLSSIAPINTSVTLLMEKQHSFDLYGRTLAYVLLPDGSCLNETLIRAGYAKPYSKYYCKALSTYQVINFEAKQEKRGLYSVVNSF